jgi:hypothetical protein
VVVSVLLTIHVDWTVGSHTAVVLMKTSSVESKATGKWQYFVERLVYFGSHYDVTLVSSAVSPCYVSMLDALGR